MLSSRSVFCLIALLLPPVAAIFSGTPANAQTAAPFVFPNTFSTIAGGGGATTPGNPCFPGSLDIATDTLGDGCPAALASFGADTRAGLVTDFLGNVYLGDTSNGLIRKIDPAAAASPFSWAAPPPTAPPRSTKRVMAAPSPTPATSAISAD